MTERHPPEPTKRSVHQEQRPLDKIRTARVYGLVLTETEVYQLLVRSADEYANEICEEHSCDVCDTFVQMWQSVYQSLSARYRLGVEEALEALDIRAPRERDGGF